MAIGIGAAILGGAVMGGIGSVLAGRSQERLAEGATESQVAGERERLEFLRQQVATGRIDLNQAFQLASQPLSQAAGLQLAPAPAAAADAINLTAGQLVPQGPTSVEQLLQQTGRAGETVGFENIPIGEFLGPNPSPQQLQSVGLGSAGQGLLNQFQPPAQAPIQAQQPQLQFQPIEGAFDPFQQATQLLQQGPGELSPQQQRQFDRGIQALQAGFSKTSGGGLSSRALEAAQIFGQDFAAKRLDEELARLTPFINLQQQSRVGLSNLAANQGTQLANLGTGTAPGIGNAFSNIGQIQAGGQIAQSNIQGQTLSNLLGLGNRAGAIAALRPELFSRTTAEPIRSLAREVPSQLTFGGLSLPYPSGGRL